MKILIICEDNAIRSQMAEGFLKSFDPKSEVFSAGIVPAAQIHPYTSEVMKEAFINQTENKTFHYKNFTEEHFDCIIALSEKVREILPEFKNNSFKFFQFYFEDPSISCGSEEEILTSFRNIRDEIKNEFFKFYKYVIRQTTHD